MYIILAILLFGVLIAAHEWGHFIAARLCGVTVHEFAIGMGPVVWKKQGKKDTQYTIRALPIGGFCAMEGEEEESDDPHSLGNQGFWKKVAVFAAGAAMNFLVGVVILLALNMGAKGFLLPVIQGGAPEFEQVNGAALEEGDVFYSINGSRVYLASDIDLLLMLAEKSLSFSGSRTAKAVVTYQAGLNITALGLLARGLTQVWGTALSRGMDASLSGVSGIGHILMGVSLVLILLDIRKKAA